MTWLPHDVGTWGLILGIAAIILTIPLGIVANLLSPKIKLWWLLRSTKGTANKLASLTRYRDHLEKELVFTPFEEAMWGHQCDMTYFVSLLAVIIVIATALIPEAHPHITFKEMLQPAIRALPFIIVIWLLFAVFYWRVFGRWLRSSPTERKKVEEQIEKTITKLRSKLLVQP